MGIRIETGVKKCPQKVVIYGPEGVGKTTLAAAMPAPLFADCEHGTAEARHEVEQEPPPPKPIRFHEAGTLVLDFGNNIEIVNDTEE